MSWSDRDQAKRRMIQCLTHLQTIDNNLVELFGMYTEENYPLQHSSLLIQLQFVDMLGKAMVTFNKSQ